MRGQALEVSVIFPWTAGSDQARAAFPALSFGVGSGWAHVLVASLDLESAVGACYATWLWLLQAVSMARDAKELQNLFEAYVKVDDGAYSADLQYADIIPPI